MVLENLVLFIFFFFSLTIGILRPRTVRDDKTNRDTVAMPMILFHRVTITRWHACGAGCLRNPFQPSCASASLGRYIFPVVGFAAPGIDSPSTISTPRVRLRFPFLAAGSLLNLRFPTVGPSRTGGQPGA